MLIMVYMYVVTLDLSSNARGDAAQKLSQVSIGLAVCLLQKACCKQHTLCLHAERCIPQRSVLCVQLALNYTGTTVKAVSSGTSTANSSNSSDVAYSKQSLSRVVGKS